MKRLFLSIVPALALSGVLMAQDRPKAAIAPVVQSPAHAGETVRVALKVSLPAGIHMQSNTPRDPLLIPTVLSFDPVPGVAVAEIVYPASTDFVQAGQKTPLAVFEQSFVVGATLTLDRSVSVGDLVLPARFRYQACDASTCFAPARESVQWNIQVVPAGTGVTRRFAEIFDRIRFTR